VKRSAERRWKIEGRERAEWDAPALAQLVVELARARVIARRLESTPMPAPRSSPENGAAA
jgi:hypothetical protein